jgi:hypothetical protein
MSQRGVLLGPEGERHRLELALAGLRCQLPGGREVRRGIPAVVGPEGKPSSHDGRLAGNDLEASPHHLWVRGDKQRPDPAEVVQDGGQQDRRCDGLRMTGIGAGDGPQVVKEHRVDAPRVNERIGDTFRVHWRTGRSEVQGRVALRGLSGSMFRGQSDRGRLYVERQAEQVAVVGLGRHMPRSHRLT